MRLPSLTGKLLAQAVRLYLTQAYKSGHIPPNRQQFKEFNESTPLEQLLSSKGVERPSEHIPGQTVIHALRIGNDWYPHMKVLICSLGESDDVVFAVDTHDRLSLPVDSPESAAFRELQNQNQALARQIEEIWEQSGVPTQASELRRYLASVRRCDKNDKSDDAG